jgi:hypothetical protein
MSLISTETKAAGVARAIAVLGVTVGAACSSSPQGSPSGSPPDSADGSAPLADDDAGIATSSNTNGGVVSTPMTTGSVPTIGGCPVFPADNPWNTRVDDTTKYPVHAMWPTYMTTMNLSTQLHPDWGDWSTDHYGIPWQTVPATQPTVPMTFEYSDESDPGPYPFPPTARVEGGAGSGGDMHVLVVLMGDCSLYETYSSRFVGPGWSCGSGAKFDLASNALRTDGWTSADAAGLPILPGLVKVSEVTAGAVNHAIRFTMDRTQQAYIHPAVHAAGKNDTTLPPMGLRLRLKASFDLGAFGGASKIVLTAMKEYGIILADNGSDWYMSGDSDDAWSPLMDALVTDLAKVQGSDFEAVETGPISTAGL